MYIPKRRCKNIKHYEKITQFINSDMRTPSLKESDIFSNRIFNIKQQQLNNKIATQNDQIKRKGWNRSH
jgi:hypothetical protein